MLSSFLIGAAIVLAFAVLYSLGTDQINQALRQRLQDEEQIAKYWGIAWGTWTIVVSLAFGLVSTTDIGQPISKLGPFVSGFGVLFGVLIAVTQYKPNDDDS